jgi:CDP-glycerol glycerophosphotransferase (TagB/SpsB family)
MTDPENLMFRIVKKFRLPPFITFNTSAFGLSDAYECFCVASKGYRQLFINKGVDPRKIVVTGIPNFDNFASYLKNDFPYQGYLLAATSDLRETKRLDNRLKFIRRVLNLAGNRKIIFKLHPNEKIDRAVREIKNVVPEALIFSEGNTNQMVANCDILVTQYSSVAYAGIALGKTVYSYYDTELLHKLAPVQNGGLSGKHIADLCLKLINDQRKAG